MLRESQLIPLHERVIAVKSKEKRGRRWERRNKNVGRSYVESIVWGFGGVPAVKFQKCEKPREDGKTREWWTRIRQPQGNLNTLQVTRLWWSWCGRHILRMTWQLQVAQ